MTFALVSFIFSEKHTHTHSLYLPLASAGQEHCQIHASLVRKSPYLPPPSTPPPPPLWGRPEKILLSLITRLTPTTPLSLPSLHLSPPLTHTPHTAYVVIDTWDGLTPGSLLYLQAPDRAEAAQPKVSRLRIFSLYKELADSDARENINPAEAGSCGPLSVFICTRQGPSCCWFRATATYTYDKWNTLLMTRTLFAISSCCYWHWAARGWRYLQLLSSSL